MPIPETVLEYIQTVKWPVLVGGVLFWERNAIKRAIERFRMPDEGSVKVPGLGDVSWKNAVQAVAEKTDEIVEQIEDRKEVEPPPDLDLKPADREYLIKLYMQSLAEYGTRRFFQEEWSTIDRLVLIDPQAAVVNAWTVFQRYIQAKAVAEYPYLSQGELRNTERLATKMNLPPELISVITQLRQLRNSVAHGQSTISPQDAFEYVQTVKRVADEVITDVLAAKHRE
jgi:hypothetical protein